MNESLPTVEEVRDLARAKLKGVCGVYRQCDGQDTRLCQGHGYGSPIGIGGIGSGASFSRNFQALDAIKLAPRLVGPHREPDTSIDFLAAKLSMPIMGASVSGVNSFGGETVITEMEFCRAMVQGCKNAGSLGWRGDSFNYSPDRAWGIDAIAEAGGRGVAIIKPREQSTVVAFFKKAEAAGCLAVGVDIDGCGSSAMARHNQPVFRKSLDELKELVGATGLPVVFKGIMTVEDALAVVEAGASVVVVSNHGGRVLDHTLGTAEVLPAIARAVGTRAMVVADGGVRTGYDVLKMIALGARAVLVGRDLIRAAVGAGAAGVQAQMKYLRDDLARAMTMTGCGTIDDITSRVLAAR
jgi:4-hydroxymandelate oxidase